MSSFASSTVWVSMARKESWRFMSHDHFVVLVVEDEALVRMSIAFSLQDAGFEVIEAADYDQAIAALVANDAIDAMFTDVDMPPGIDGLHLAIAVRRRWPPVEIIVTSGKRHIRNENLPVSGRFLAKPYDGDKVAMSLREMIGFT